MGWGNDLWDQYSNLGIHTQRGIDFLEKFNNYIKDRCQVENEYAMKLKSLVKKYQPRKKNDEDYQFTYAQAFLGVLGELNDIASQHEVVSESFRDQIQTELVKSARDFKELRKSYLTQAEKLQQNFEGSVMALEKAKKDYAKAFREAELAEAKYQKADADLNLSRAEVEKSVAPSTKRVWLQAKQNAISKGQLAEEAKSTYALQLQQTNESQRHHYREKLPNVYEQLREMDEQRILIIRELLLKCVQVEQGVKPLIVKCLEGMVAKANEINPQRDSTLVVERYRSGYEPPENIPFIDLSAGGDEAQLTNGLMAVHVSGASPSPAIATSSRATVGRKKSHKILRNIFGGPSKADEFKEDFSDLPPQQRCKHLQKRVTELEASLRQLENARDGIMKLQKVYETNPKKGDLSEVNSALARNATEITALQAELEKFRAYLNDAVSQLNLPINHVVPSTSHLSPHPPGISTDKQERKSLPTRPKPPTNISPPQDPQRSSLSDGSLSRSASDSSVPGANYPSGASSGSKTSARRNETSHQTTAGSSVSPESGIDTSRLSFVDSEPSEIPIEEEVYTDADAPVLGSAMAMFAFDGTSEGTISIREGENLLLIEKDEGDGWTRVKRHNEEEGFVPTSYLECHYVAS